MLKEIVNPIKRRIYVVNARNEVLSTRDYYGNILDSNGKRIDSMHSDYEWWKRQP